MGTAELSLTFVTRVYRGTDSDCVTGDQFDESVDDGAVFGGESPFHSLDGAFSDPRAFDVGAGEVLLDLFESAVATGGQPWFPNVVDEPLVSVSDRHHDVIAHRLSTIQDADRIVVMDDGEIREVGTHDELVARNSSYDDLWQSQMTTDKVPVDSAVD